MTKTIASIYFYKPNRAERPLYQGYYNLPAVAKGDPPFLLTVKDEIQIEYTLWVQGHQQIKRTILGEEIAPDICREWAEGAPGMTAECGPGIWVVRDTVEDGGVQRPATAEERAQMLAEDTARNRERQARWAEYQILAGDTLAADPKTLKYITPLMRESCRYMGRERTWLQQMKDNDVKTCPFCVKSIAWAAVKCPYCNEVVDFEAYAVLQARKQAAMGAIASMPEAVGVNP